MGVQLSAGPPLEAATAFVGRRTTLLVDAARERTLGIDCWYPALGDGCAASVYELLPGVGFTASALADAPPVPGAHPLVVWSHGRSGTRSSYALLCEGLAARGYVVVAPDHPGDMFADWLLGAAVDDRTNETQRVDDVRCVLDTVLGGPAGLGLPAGIDVDADRIAVAGHSYGAFTAFALAAAEPADPRIHAVAGLQSLTRTLPASALARIDIPALMVVGTRDTSTPPEIDADAAFAALDRGAALRVDVEHAGHQACSDVGLYLELAPRVDGLSELIVDFVKSMAADVTGTAGDPWRPTVALHLRVLAAWLDEHLDHDRERGRSELDAIRATRGVAMSG